MKVWVITEHGYDYAQAVAVCRTKVGAENWLIERNPHALRDIEERENGGFYADSCVVERFEVL